MKKTKTNYNRKTICDIKHGQHSQLTAHENDAYENHPQYEWIACLVFNFNLDLSSKCSVHPPPAKKYRY